MITRNLFLITLCCLNTLVAQQIVDTDNQVHPALITLFSELDIKIQEPTLTNVVDYTQREWLRAKGQERWHMQEKYADHRDEIVHCVDELGCAQEVQAQRNEYDIVVILGATYFRMQDRINYLIREYNRGVRFKEIVFVSSHRPLDPEVERDALALTYDGKFLTTEADAMHYIVEHTNFPFTFSEVKKTYIDVPMITDGSGNVRRPATEDNMSALSLQFPTTTSCLLVSNQPYRMHQDAVARMYLPSSWYIETVGSQASPTTTNAAYLDNIARILYQYKKLADQKSKA